ncbi:hypothetical protein [Halalkalicoccus sp. NIPERK01]|uniref:hypothetical protein n=1 Tax=Halalkalicoccus sp. NIPERK01 TaxID=3053469 RepID=UPI00256EA914|nr:hypothetical protein [Halalkalicoccus sp. NIPERK01]MDL5363476.1 hypothetical protein [Halalkalicoccus sp. NIPERK01]
MGLFKRIGRQVERVKRTATETAQEDTNYRCQACDARFHIHHDQCPECEARSIVSTSTGE